MSKITKKGRPKTKPIKQCVCKQCNKNFELIYDDRSGLFCSKKCCTQFSRENSTSYRIKAFALLPNECFYCSEKNINKLIVHHFDYNFLNNEIDNLQILCKHCHSKEHINNSSRNKKFKDGQILRGIRMVLDGLRLNLKDENFKETPQRILRSYYEIFEGLNNKDKINEILSTSFPTGYDGMVIEGPIKTYSMCPHHFLPVVYDIYVGYIPNKGGLGLSKIPRLVELLAHTPKLQEDFTKEIVDIINKTIKPKGVMVKVMGQHLCMQMRGIKAINCGTITSSFCGVFEEKDARDEFISFVNGGK